MTTWPWADARLHAARARIADLEAGLARARMEAGEWEDEASKCIEEIERLRARLDAVVALCDRTYGSAESYKDLVLDASEVRAIAMGEQP